MRTRICPACEHPQSHTVGTKNGFEIQRCDRCQTLYTRTLPAPNQKFDYQSLEVGSIPEYIHQRMRKVVQSFSEYRQTNRFLEVGFGAGHIISKAHELGWDVYGVEVSKPAIAKAKKQGFNVFWGDVTAAGYPDNYFDVVVASEVIEHLEQPAILVAEVQRILRPNGLFWLTTPSAGGLSYRLLGNHWSVVCPPWHLCLFSGRGIYQLLANHGFDRINITSRGFNYLEPLRYYFKSGKNNIQSYQESVEPIHRINTKIEGNPFLKSLKNLVMLALKLTGTGDTLVVASHKP